MRRFRIRNWNIYQHYRDRNPPWIKLHFAMLSSKDWVSLDNESRVLAIACMLIASKEHGTFLDDPDYVTRVAYLHGPPNFQPLLDCGFLELDSKRKQMLADARPEKRREEKNREEKRRVDSDGKNAGDKTRSFKAETEEFLKNHRIAK